MLDENKDHEKNISPQGTYYLSGISQVSREKASSARWRPENGGSGPRNDAMSLASPPGAVATDWSLRPVSAAPPLPGLLPNALEYADAWDMMKVFTKS